MVYHLDYKMIQQKFLEIKIKKLFLLKRNYNLLLILIIKIEKLTLKKIKKVKRCLKLNISSFVSKFSRYSNPADRT